MATFNLGHIKGPKGDPGPKGDKGDKGDTGARGIKGEDAVTPVFHVENVTTLPHGSEANVIVDSSDITEPRLSFYIPAGKDGSDGIGDMQKSIYDSEDIGIDFYSYARELFEKAAKTEGAVMTGKLVAYGGNLAERSVRNIIFSEILPPVADEGDVCFLLNGSKGKKLSEYDVGSLILLREGNTDAEYIVVAKDYYKEGGVTLARRYLSREEFYYDYARRDEYKCSDVDVYLETILAESYQQEIKDNLLYCEIDGYTQRRCFSPSKYELTDMEYFAANGIKASFTVGNTGEEYMSRDLNDSNFIITVTSSGGFSAAGQSKKLRVRPIITLDGNMYFENSINNKVSVAVPLKNQKKIYFYEGGMWKEMNV